MTLRSKLLLAQAPIVLAIVALGVTSHLLVASVGRRTEMVLKNNYQSILAAERMKDAAGVMNDGAVQLLHGRAEDGRSAIEATRSTFETQLVNQEGNITEVGEREATQRLRVAWTAYGEALTRLEAAPGADLYENEVRPRYMAVRDGAEEILSMNQFAMSRKSDQAIRFASSMESVLATAAIAACVFGLAATIWLTSRLLRPLSVLRQAVRRLGEGDLVARAQVRGADEIAGLARDFNGLADHLAQYRKSSLGELLVAQSAAQAVIDSLPDAVVVIGLRGEVLNANRSADELLKIRVETGKGLGDADPTVRAAIERASAHVLGGNGAYVPRGLEEAFRVATPDGERHFLPRATPVYGEEGAIDGTTVVLQDVTRLLRFDELKDNLVATVAHEFRTPLTSLRMAIHMCAEGAVGELNEKQKDLLYVAREDCERLQSIVDDLLDMSRIQSGKIEVTARRVSAEALVNEAVDTHRAMVEANHVVLRSEMLPGIGDVAADPDRLQLVFSNLIANAVRHTQSGEIIVRALPSATGAEAVRFEVADTGAGIAPEHQASIFEKFYRVPGAPSGGAGLGLFIAKEIVEAHGGTIGFESTPGRGTTFWFTIPTSI